MTQFGLKTYSGSLTRHLDSVLSEEVKRFTTVYVDDCLCVFSSVEKHLSPLQILLVNLNAANITLNLKKLQFFHKEVNYFGYWLSNKSIATNTDNITAIHNIPRSN